MPKERHTLFFSATMSNDIKVLVKDFLRDPVTVSVVQQATSKNIDQDVIRYGTEDNKFTELCRVIEQHPKQKILIFGRQKHGVKDLERDLMNRGFSADSLHGNKTHAQRVRAMEKFKEGRVSILVATDVAARGLDIKGINLVINYELPESHDDYVHRIGRTGRGEHQGKALTFIK
jgi:superfamily II DNA/RNA helicase